MSPAPLPFSFLFIPSRSFLDSLVNMRVRDVPRCRKHTVENLPSVSRPESSTLDIHIDAQAVVQAVKDELSRRS